MKCSFCANVLFSFGEIIQETKLFANRSSKKGTTIHTFTSYQLSNDQTQFQHNYALYIKPPANIIYYSRKSEHERT